MDKPEIRQNLVGIVNDTLGLEVPITEADICGQLDELENNLLEEMDSIKLLALVVAVEDYFQICIEPEDEEQIKCFDDLIKVIHHQLNKIQIENKQQGQS